MRVDGRDLRCKVVGEGANLGFTQAGRIEYALGGGRIDTDAIDNSAGVDTSDHEVNIKILTGMAERAGKLEAARRATPLLASMTDEIAAHVLAHNYDQTLALSLLEAEARRRPRRPRRLHGRPGGARAARPRRWRACRTPAEIAERAQGRAGPHPARAGGAAGLRQARPGRGRDRLGRARTIRTSSKTLKGYFPKALAPFEDEMRRHRLRREIIATVRRQRHGQPLRPDLPDAG